MSIKYYITLATCLIPSIDKNVYDIKVRFRVNERNGKEVARVGGVVLSTPKVTTFPLPDARLACYIDPHLRLFEFDCAISVFIIQSF